MLSFVVLVENKNRIAVSLGHNLPRRIKPMSNNTSGRCNSPLDEPTGSPLDEPVGSPVDAPRGRPVGSPLDTFLDEPIGETKDVGSQGDFVGSPTQDIGSPTEDERSPTEGQERSC